MGGEGDGQNDVSLPSHGISRERGTYQPISLPVYSQRWTWPLEPREEAAARRLVDENITGNIKWKNTEKVD